MAIQASHIRKGMTIMHNGAPHKVLEFHHHTPGNLRAFIDSAKRSASTHGAPTSSNGLVVPRASDAIVPSNSTVPG